MCICHICCLLGTNIIMSTTLYLMYISASGVDLNPLIVTTAMLGKFGIAGSYAIVFLYASELYPTVVR